MEDRMADGGVGVELSHSAARPAAPPPLRCAAIVAADPWYRKLGTEAAAAAMAADGVEPVWLANPLPSKLTLHRLLIQLGAEDAGGPAGDDEARFAAALARRRDAKGQVVVVISQAETLDRAALPVLQRLASGPDAVRIVFVGTPGFWTLLEGDELSPLRHALGHVAGPATPRPAASVPDAGPEPRRRMPRLRKLMWGLGAVAVLAALGAGGVAAVLAPGGLFYRAAPQRTAYVITPAPLRPAIAEARAAPEARDPPVATPGVPPASGTDGRIVIHYRDGSTAGEAAANRVAALAGPLASRTQLRKVPTTPTAATIRFFHAEDEARARDLAVALRPFDVAWDVKNATSFRPAPSARTIEVWLPGR
jgi:hypothetical protein